MAVALTFAGSGGHPAEASIGRVADCDKHTFEGAKKPVDPKDPSKDKVGHLGDGDGDGKQNDVLLGQDKLKNTIERIWCIEDKVNGPYYAFLVDGVENRPYAFVGKCSWPFGDNKQGDDIGSGFILKSTTWESSDGSGKGHKGTGNKWKYKYDVETDTLTVEKVDKNGRTLQGPQTIRPAPKRPFKYGDLPGGGDPTRCRLKHK